ncbi:ABC transporter permease subunit [Chryseobacterium indologenes]|uniref:ABC transporter permease subunit n=1 Tax=Chryseobacterium indologenes TaxID=253 RepID=A0A411DM93_CHRID|nr:ABC transporter permease subunit [Chryseobacterium indologenes]
MSEQSFWQFITEQHEKLLTQVVQHLGLTFLSLFLAIIIGVPLGILIARKRKLSGSVLGLAGILQTIPSIALLGFMIPVFGIGAVPAIVALLIYALLPIIRNTYTGITEVDPAVTEAAKAMGMEFIFGGISLNNTNMILAGAIPAALLAVLLDQTIAVLQKLSYQSVKKLKYIIPAVLAVIGIVYFLTSVSNHKIKAGFTPEFMGRQDGNLGLRSVYGLDAHPLVVSDAIMYKAAYEKELDLISGYSTDGRIKAFDLYVLEDDKKIFPPYFAAPVIKTKTLEKLPGLEKTLNLLAGKFNDSIMTELNYKADYLKQTPEKIAKDFLMKTNLYKDPRKGNSQTIKIGSKIFGEQYILAEMYKMLIEGYTDYKVETKTGLGGTKICFDALMNDAIDVYPEYTGTGLLVLLKPSAKTIEEVSGSPEKTLDYVNREFRKHYGIEWLQPLGFNNAYALMMRRKQADELKIKTISDLKKYMDSQ